MDILSELLSDSDSDSPFPHTSRTTASLIGIAVAISGNILISFALNCQKLAHKQIEDSRSEEPETGRGRQDEPAPMTTPSSETQPLLLNGVGIPSNPRSYSAPNQASNAVSVPMVVPLHVTTASPPRSIGRSSRNRPPPLANGSQTNKTDNSIAEEPSDTNGGSHPQPKKTSGPAAESRFANSEEETEYLRSKLWCVHHTPTATPY